MSTKKAAKPAATADASPKKPRRRRSPDEIIADAEKRLAAAKRAASKAHPAYKSVRAARKTLMEAKHGDETTGDRIAQAIAVLDEIATLHTWEF